MPTGKPSSSVAVAFGGRPVLERLVEHIAAQGIGRVVICGSERNRNQLAALKVPASVEVQFRFESLPRGTAGAIGDALEGEPSDLLLFVFYGAMLTPPELPLLMREHQQGGGCATLFFDPCGDTSEQVLKESGICVCQADIAQFIPVEGYFDFKENLIPVLVQADCFIASACLPYSSGTYRNWRQYRNSIQQYLLSLKGGQAAPLPGFSRIGPERPLWVAENVQIDPTVAIIGPVMIGPNSSIGEESFLFGPLMIESDVQILPYSTVSSSVLWKGAVVGSHSYIDSCLVDEAAVVAPRTEAVDRLFLHLKGIVGSFVKKYCVLAGRREKPCPERTLSSLLAQPYGKISAAALFVFLLASLLVVYWNPTLIDLWHIWLRSDEYSSGMLVPLLVGYLIWERRKNLLECAVRPFPPALFVLLFVQILRMGALLIGSGTLERLSFFLTIGSLIWLVLGWSFLKRTFSVWLYLILMFPLPKMVEWKITFPLQKWATVSAVFCLEALGFDIIREGNIININGTLVAVAEACNGLRMLTAFFVVSGFIVLICRRRLWEKVLIFFSSVPIALLCNTIRLTLTSIAFLFLEGQFWEKVFHDYGGLAMMPLALFLIGLEL